MKKCHRGGIQCPECGELVGEPADAPDALIAEDLRNIAGFLCAYVDADILHTLPAQLAAKCRALAERSER